MSRVVLINPPPRNALDRHWAPFPVLGLAYVAASLRAQGHEVNVLDGKLDELSASEIVLRTLELRPELIGITAMTVEFPMARQLAKQLRAANRDTPILLGGAHINAVRERALLECPEADFACIGEGEQTACELLAALRGERSVCEVRGLAYRDGARVRTTSPRAYPDNYDLLPFPAWDLFRVGDQIPILTHRGCPFECNFCGHNSGFQARYRTPANVLDELEYTIQHFQPRVIRFEDETFGLNLKRTKLILQGILDRRLHERAAFSAQTRVDRIDAHFVQLLKACNFQTLELGVESGSEAIVVGMGKGITLSQVENAVALARQAGLRVWCKFILGHPHETKRTLWETVAFIARLNPDRLSVSIMTPFPGTPIFDMAVRGEGGYRLLSDNWQDFDKYGTGALELESASLKTLKAFQLLCYLALYIPNHRVPELIRFSLKHRDAAAGMLLSLLTAAWPRQSKRGRVRDTSHPDIEQLPLSSVAMPDKTLVRIRERGHRGPSRRSQAPQHAVRSWAVPGAENPAGRRRSGAV